MYTSPDTAYLPTGPSDSAAVRALAEDKYDELMKSSAIQDRNAFFKWTQDLTNDLIGMKELFVHTKISLVSKKKVSYPYERELNIFDKLGTAEMKIPCTSSLDKLKKSREQLSRYLSTYDTENASEGGHLSYEIGDSNRGPLSAEIPPHTELKSEKNNDHIPPLSSEAVGNGNNITPELPKKSDVEPMVRSNSSFIACNDKDNELLRRMSDGVDFSGDWKNSSAPSSVYDTDRFFPGEKRDARNRSVDLSAFSADAAKSLLPTYSYKYGKI